jgi:superfamily I DNA and/or RNA helicase
MTVDKVHNVQKDIIIVSCIKHNRKCVNLKDIRKIYTTFTRAQKKLILVGSMANLKEVDPLDMFIGYIRKKNWYIDINNHTQLKKYFPAEA